MKFFEQQLSLKPKGFYKVWQAIFRLSRTGRETKLFLHAVNDSKPVYRISTKYAGLPKQSLQITDRDLVTGKKVKQIVETSPAHSAFRKLMGFNDQSDAKRSLIGLSAKYYKNWPKHLVAKSIEDAIINGYLDYLLDPSCSIEPWPVFLY